MERKQVYKLIDGERDYQNSKPPRPVEDVFTPISSWLIYIEKQLNDAKVDIYKLDGAAAMESVRKIAALAVACMENNETPPREG